MRAVSHPDWESADAPARFAAIARTAVEVLLEQDPAEATALGEHRYDGLLRDWTPEAVQTQLADLADAIGALDDLDDSGLDRQDVVDHELLRSRLAGRSWAVAELAEQRWNPLAHLPGEAIYGLVARPAVDPAQRAHDLVDRLKAVPHALELARGMLDRMPAVHVETAIDQTRGVIGLLGEEVDLLLAEAPHARSRVDEARSSAAQALEEHARWLTDQLVSADGDPRLGAHRFAGALWFALDTEIGPDALLTRAESHLMEVEEQISDLAARLGPRLGVSGPGTEPGRHVRDVLDAAATLAPVTDSDVLARCHGHLGTLTELVSAQELVSVPPGLIEAVQLIEMPQVRRGVAVAYCDAPGALEPDVHGRAPATFFAVAPTPQGWSDDRVRSFYREYNDHMLRNLTAHEAMPGHVLQLARSREFRGSTLVRAALGSGTFVEGWAVYAEGLVADLVEAVEGDSVGALCLRLHQLKMQLRSTINAILDVRVHTRGMTEDEAMALMTGRGHQEEGEAAGKWRRALLTHAQLSTYFVGHQEVAGLAMDLSSSRPDLSRRQVHDAMLGHGSPSPRLLRTLVGLS